jgi:hypothetical protein
MVYSSDRDQRWEYFVMYIEVGGLFRPDIDPRSIEESFNNAGAESWELVNIIDTNRSSGRTGEILAIFKRPY